MFHLATCLFRSNTNDTHLVTATHALWCITMSMILRDVNGNVRLMLPWMCVIVWHPTWQKLITNKVCRFLWTRFDVYVAILWYLGMIDTHIIFEYWLFFLDYVFKNVICEMAIILFRSQYNGYSAMVTSINLDWYQSRRWPDIFLWTHIIIRWTYHQYNFFASVVQNGIDLKTVMLWDFYSVCED